jgi:hypothetical protein
VIVGALLTVAGLASSCGGVGVEAPRVIGADEDTGCPSAEDALARTREALGITDHDGAPSALDELRPALVRVLIDDGGLRVLFQGVVAIIDDTDPVTTRRLLSGINPEEGLGGLTRHLVEVLRYIDGSSAYVEGAHLEPIGAAHDILTTCDAPETFSTARRLLQLEVTYGPDGPTLAEAGQGEEPWLNAVLESARAAFDDPALRDVLDRIELEDPDAPPGDPNAIHVGKDAFQLLAKLLAGNLAAPDFDAGYTRQLLDDVILSRITDDAARKRVDDLLDLVLLVTDPSAAVFPQVQSLMGCVNHADADAAIPGLLFDWLTIQELSVDEFLDDVSASTGSPSAGDLRLALIDVLGALEARPNVARDVTRVGAQLIDDETAPLVVRAVLRLQGTGMLTEVSELAATLEECR